MHAYERVYPRLPRVAWETPPIPTCKVTRTWLRNASTALPHFKSYLLFSSFPYVFRTEPADVEPRRGSTPFREWTDIYKGRERAREKERVVEDQAIHAMNVVARSVKASCLAIVRIDGRVCMRHVSWCTLPYLLLTCLWYSVCKHAAGGGRVIYASRVRLRATRESAIVIVSSRKLKEVLELKLET